MEGTPVRRATTPAEVDAKVRADGAQLAREIRDRRRLLGMSQGEVARLATISRTVVNQIENASRIPSVRTYARLRAALGLEPPPAAVIPSRPPRPLGADVLVALCAALVARQRVALAELASALAISVPAVRENLDTAAERLRAVGFSITEDGGEVRLWPLPGGPTEAVRCLTVTEETPRPSAEQLEILVMVAYLGPQTRAQVEAVRGHASTSLDSESLLARMVRQGLLARVRSESRVGAPNVYSITAKALRATGYPSVDAMRDAIASDFSAQQQAAAVNACERRQRHLNAKRGM
ncbi:MAG: SMC-Scp complex subunit ScpB [Candidatus Dormibacteraeota bacterium]|nr:SMC-Scp complex subunit ScpB [Candidatus Dormibacteraeota bacterium]